MSPVTFTLKDIPRQRVDCSALTPTRLAGRSPADIAAIELPCGNRKPRVEELFELQGEDTSSLVFRNACDKLDRIGEAMFDGSIEVEGDTGAYLGLGLRGGRITVRGNCGAFAAAEMKRGLVHVCGNAGDFLGAALPGNRQGMRGGMVIVGGNVADRCADRLRRGSILIEGDAGDYCASRMIAGTLAVLGTVGAYPVSRCAAARCSSRRRPLRCPPPSAIAAPTICASCRCWCSPGSRSNPASPSSRRMPGYVDSWGILPATARVKCWSGSESACLALRLLRAGTRGLWAFWCR